MTNLVALPKGTELVGDYRIDRVLGAGGFGVTYLADELALSRAVTIKEYFPSDFAARADGIEAHPRSQDHSSDYQWGLDRFIEEAQTLARFNHANIVRVYRYFRANNTGYMVLHFEEGKSLKSWLKDLHRAPRQREIDGIIAPLLDALELIHAADFLHRDIAPDNIIIRSSGDPVLIDFGSARGEMAANPKTVSALVKPGYSPYEQYAETSKQQGPWTDIYALAATLYHAICGRRPPDAPSRMLKDEFVPAREAAIGAYRQRFLAAIDKALSLQPDDRPQSVAAWRGELLAPDAPKASWLGKLRERTAGKRAAVEEAKAKVETVVVAGTALPPPPDAPGAHGGMLDFVDSLKGGEADAKPSRERTLKARLAKVKTDPPKPKAKTEPPAPLPPPGKTRVKGAHAVAVRAPAKPAPKPVARRQPGRTRVWFGRMIAAAAIVAVVGAFHDRIPQLVIKATAPGTTTVNSVTSAYARLGAFRAYTGPVTAIGYTADGDRIVTAAGNGTLDIWSASTQRLEGSIRLDDGPVTSLSLSSGRALTSHEDGAVAIWDLNSRSRIARFKRNEARVWAATFAGSPNRVAAGAHDWSVALWDEASQAAPAFLLDGHTNSVQALAVDPGRRWLATGSADKTVRLWDLSSRALIRTYNDNRDFVTALAFSNSGTLLAAGSLDGSIRVWSTGSGRVQRTFRAHEGRVNAVSFWPAGEILASIGDDGVVKVRGLQRPRSLHTLPPTDGAARAIAFAPDGRTLATADATGLVTFWAMPAARVASR